MSANQPTVATAVTAPQAIDAPYPAACADGKAYWPVVGSLAALGGLYLASLHSYLLFHSLAELFSVAVALAISMIAWNSKQFLERGYFLLLGIAFLFVGILDLLHTLAYRGMGVFPGSDGNLATQFWLAARFLESLSFVAATWFLRRRVKPWAVFGVYGAVLSLLLALILIWRVFPICFVEGQGLSGFKVGSEYVICMALLYALALHRREGSAFDPAVLRLISAALLVTITSELAFTLYVSVYGLANFVGHYLKLVSFYLIYKALVQVALTKPLRLLFLDLKRSHEQMRQYREHLETVNRQLQASLQQLSEDETAARRIQFLLLPPRRMVHHDCEFESAIRTSALLSGDFVDYFPITSDLTGFYIADVSGHGVSSAFITVLLKSTMGHLLDEHIKGNDDTILHPDRVLRLLNEYLFQQHFGKYLTMFYAILNTAQHTMTFSNAGQFPSPIFADQRGARFLEQKSLPVGLFPESHYDTMEVTCESPFRMVLFSDGVLEALPDASVRSKQQFLLSQVASNDVSLEQLETNLGLCKVESPDDDLTILLLKQAA